MNIMELTYIKEYLTNEYDVYSHRRDSDTETYTKEFKSNIGGVDMMLDVSYTQYKNSPNKELSPSDFNIRLTDGEHDNELWLDFDELGEELEEHLSDKKEIQFVENGVESVRKAALKYKLDATLSNNKTGKKSIKI